METSSRPFQWARGVAGSWREKWLVEKEAASRAY
jgi:hypothetical protein